MFSPYTHTHTHIPSYTRVDRLIAEHRSWPSIGKLSHHTSLHLHYILIPLQCLACQGTKTQQPSSLTTQNWTRSLVCLLMSESSKFFDTAHHYLHGNNVHPGTPAPPLSRSTTDRPRTTPILSPESTCQSLSPVPFGQVFESSKTTSMAGPLTGGLTPTPKVSTCSSLG